MIWEPPPPSRSKLRLVILVMMVVGLGAGLLVWRDYFGPRRNWRRAVAQGTRQTRADLWSKLQRDKTIRGLDPSATIREVYLLVDDPDPETRAWAVATIPALGPDPVEAIARVGNRLLDREAMVRARAATALGDLVRRNGPGRELSLALLGSSVQDPDPLVRLASVGSIGQLVFEGGRSMDPLRSGQKDDPALELVASRVDDPDPGVRVEAAYVLACNDRGGANVPMLAALIKAQKPGEAPDRATDRAFLALMSLAVHSDEAAFFLNAEMALDREGYPDRPRDALAWAARQTPEARARVQRLVVRDLESDDPSYRHNAAILLHEIGSDQKALPVLVEALGNPSVDLRIRAVEALADLGDSDPTIVPALQAASNDPDRNVREHALSALEAIELAKSGVMDVP